MARIVLGEMGLNETWLTGWVSDEAEPLTDEGSTDLKARMVEGVREGKSWNLRVQSLEPVTIRPPDASSVMDVTARSCVLKTISCDTGYSSSSSSSSSSESSSSSSESSSSLSGCETTGCCLLLCSNLLSAWAPLVCLPNEVVPRNF